ncbi:hypothetical protein [Actinomadura alba]|uniref:Uncharacterized protein n=1 Tax=Actinomadura alba TaxID=406431 RepID=A0ABR7LK74_9ACTN|nr:hypothetical protein [Actinomadura alba]MBC6464984.1 hypothetical protein [Actinomadura alba]
MRLRRTLDRVRAADRRVLDTMRRRRQAAAVNPVRARIRPERPDYRQYELSPQSPSGAVPGGQ